MHWPMSAPVTILWPISTHMTILANRRHCDHTLAGGRPCDRALASQLPLTTLANQHPCDYTVTGQSAPLWLYADQCSQWWHLTARTSCEVIIFCVMQLVGFVEVQFMDIGYPLSHMCCVLPECCIDPMLVIWRVFAFRSPCSELMGYRSVELKYTWYCRHEKWKCALHWFLSKANSISMMSELMRSDCLHNTTHLQANKDTPWSQCHVLSCCFCTMSYWAST